MAHANARLNVHGRRLLVQRVVVHGRPVSHVAKELGVSRQCAHRWLARFRAEGEAGLADRSSRPHRCPRRTPAEVEERVLELRRGGRRGQDWIGPELGVPARTVAAILRRHQMPYLRECDPLTGELIRSSKATGVRYEHDHPGSLGHMDVKKLGKIPDRGGWRARGRAATSAERDRRQRHGRTGFNYVHSLVDDHSRLAYSEVLPDEKGATCAGFLERAIDYFAEHGLPLLASRGLRRSPDQADLHPTPLPLAERHGRTIQPHHPDRMGLPTDLPHQHRTHRSTGALAGVLQR